MIPLSSMFRSVMLAAALVWATAEAAPPERIKLSYEVNYGTMHGDVVETLEHDGRTYSIVSETRDGGSWPRSATSGPCEDAFWRKAFGPTSTGTSVRLAGWRPRNSTGSRAR